MSYFLNILHDSEFTMKLSSLEQLAASRQNLEHILDHLQEGIIGHGQDRKIFYFNRAAEVITGYAKAEVLGKDCYEAFGAPFCGSHCSFCGAPPQGWTRISYPINIVTKAGGAPADFRMCVVGMTDEQGGLIGVLASFQDITSLAGLKLWTEEFPGFAGLVGRDPKLLQIFRQIKMLAVNDYAVLHHRRDRHRQGIGGRRHPQREPAEPRPLRASQLRGPAGRRSGERALRPRQGGLLRGRSGIRRAVSA